MSYKKIKELAEQVIHNAHGPGDTAPAVISSGIELAQAVLEDLDANACYCIWCGKTWESTESKTDTMRAHLKECQHHPIRGVDEEAAAIAA